MFTPTAERTVSRRGAWIRVRVVVAEVAPCRLGHRSNSKSSARPRARPAPSSVIRLSGTATSIGSSLTVAAISANVGAMSSAWTPVYLDYAATTWQP